MQYPDSTPVTIGGYRVVRRLGRGSRADVVLATGTTGSVALKNFRPELPRADVGREIEALLRAQGQHCARLVDVLSGSGRHPVLAFEPLEGGGVAEWLRDRREVAPGEAVTLLAPVAATITRLHRTGLVHGKLGAASIHFGAAGEPVILGFGHATVVDPGADLTLDAGRQASGDRMALAALAHLVVAATIGAQTSAGAQALMEWFRTQSPAPSIDFAVELERRLFDFASPVPLEFSSPDHTSQPPPAPLVIAPALWPEGRAQERRDRLVPSGVARGNGRHASTGPKPSTTWMTTLLDASPARLAKRAALPAIRSVRRPVWVVAGGVGIALVIVLVTIPSGGGAQTVRAHTSLRQQAVVAGPTPAPSTPQPTPSPDVSRALSPLVALPGLLTHRALCFSDRSVGCLSTVDDAASGALTHDSETIARMQRGGESARGAAWTAPAPKLIEQLGGSALVQLDGRGAGVNANPASVLMIKTKAGWRIRSYLSGRVAQGG